MGVLRARYLQGSGGQWHGRSMQMARAKARTRPVYRGWGRGCRCVRGGVGHRGGVRGLSTDVRWVLLFIDEGDHSYHMEINGHELTSIAFMAAGGPLWNTTGPSGTKALATLRSASEGSALEERWRAWAAVKNAHVVALIDVARHHDGRWAVVMDNVEGQTLEALLAQGQPRSIAEKRRIASGIRQGVAAWHDAGLVHGDIAPSNVIVRPDGTPVIVDVIDDPERSMGTPGWSAQCGGGQEGDIMAMDKLVAALGVGSSVASAESGTPHGDTEAGGGAVGGDTGDLFRHMALSAVTEHEDHRDISGLGRWGITLTRDGPRSLTGTTRSASVDQTLHPPQGRRHFWWAAAVLGLVVCAVGAWMMGIGPQEAREWMVQADADQPLTTSDDTCMGSRAAQTLLIGLVAQRDQAIRDGDTLSLDRISTGQALVRDAALINALQAGGVTVKDLRTRVGNVEAIECSDEQIVISTTMRQTHLEKCPVRGPCLTVSEQPERRVKVHLSGDPLRVGEIETVESMEIRAPSPPT